MLADIQQIHIPSDESLEQGRNRSRVSQFGRGRQPSLARDIIGCTDPS